MGLGILGRIQKSEIVLLNFNFSMQYSSSSRVLNCIREVDGASPSIAEARSVAQLVEQQHPHEAHVSRQRAATLGGKASRWFDPNHFFRFFCLVDRVVIPIPVLSKEGWCLIKRFECIRSHLPNNLPSA